MPRRAEKKQKNGLQATEKRKSEQMRLAESIRSGRSVHRAAAQLVAVRRADHRLPLLTYGSRSAYSSADTYAMYQQLNVSQWRCELSKSRFHLFTVYFILFFFLYFLLLFLARSRLGSLSFVADLNGTIYLNGFSGILTARRFKRTNVDYIKSQSRLHRLVTRSQTVNDISFLILLRKTSETRMIFKVSANFVFASASRQTERQRRTGIFVLFRKTHFDMHYSEAIIAECH